MTRSGLSILLAIERWQGATRKRPGVERGGVMGLDPLAGKPAAARGQRAQALGERTVIRHPVASLTA